MSGAFGDTRQHVHTRQHVDNRGPLLLGLGPPLALRQSLSLLLSPLSFVPFHASVHRSYTYHFAKCH